MIITKKNRYDEEKHIPFASGVPAGCGFVECHFVQ